jgi:starch phosphorylase
MSLSEATHHSLLSESRISDLEKAIVNHLIYLLGKDPVDTHQRDWFEALARVVRDLLTTQWMESMRSYYLQDAKRVYYLSMEFLMGRTLGNALQNMQCSDDFRHAVEEMGLRLEEISQCEAEAGLGNGGLGRLAACFLDSLASLDMPGFGYGIRYEYGMFTQQIEQGWQVEHPDNWLRYGNPWEFPRTDVIYRVQFKGNAQRVSEEGQPAHYVWTETEDVMAMAYDTPIPGYGGKTVNNLRLWSAKASRDFDLRYFNEGNYIRAVEQKTQSENLSKVLYPDDTTQMGRELRLRQEYFFVAATLQDILSHFTKDHDSFEELPNEVAIQLNDTHPSIAIPELMRILVDQYRLEWDKAWAITLRTFAYTNHTLLPEALETWPVGLIGRLLPRHLLIIYEINRRFLAEVSRRFPGDMGLIRRVSLIDEEHGQRVRMSHLAIVGSHKINGVAKLHSLLMQTTIFSDFAKLYPDRFINITNGVTPRRWLDQANRGLSGLISEAIGPAWISDLERLRQLEPFADAPAFRERFRAVKHLNKASWAETLISVTGVSVDPSSLFDVQIKRIHEYKRQLLNVLHVVTRYNRLLMNPAASSPPRTVIIGGKAAPGYQMAKLIIKLINDVAAVINRDPVVSDKLKLVFLPDYNVSRAMDLIPAVDLSEQISTAGTEASGTSNMKMALNGALTIGTLDGANIEIREAVGSENFFLFGRTANELADLRQQGYNPWDRYHANVELRQSLDMIASGFFSPDDPERFQPLVDSLLQGGDRYALLEDYGDYLAAQEKVDRLYLDPDEWSYKAILNVARSGSFSSDRAIQTYASEVWGVSPRQT